MARLEYTVLADRVFEQVKTRWTDLSSKLRAWRKYRTYPMAEANGKFGNLVIPKAETVSLIEPALSVNGIKSTE